MDSLAKDFSFLNESFATPTNTRYLAGKLDNLEIMISQQRDQYIMTVNHMYFIISIGSIDEIREALKKLQRKEDVKPNQLAMMFQSALFGTRKP